MIKKVEVLKAFSGLDVGDILWFNPDSHLYEKHKVEEDLSDNMHTIKRIDLSFSSKEIKNNPQLFKFVKEEDEVIEFRMKTKEEIEQKIEDLNKLIEHYEIRNYNPFNWIATEIDKAKYQLVGLNWVLGKYDE
jgi:hypothetical protein